MMPVMPSIRVQMQQAAAFKEDFQIMVGALVTGEHQGLRRDQEHHQIMIIQQQEAVLVMVDLHRMVILMVPQEVQDTMVEVVLMLFLHMEILEAQEVQGLLISIFFKMLIWLVGMLLPLMHQK